MGRALTSRAAKSAAFRHAGVSASDVRKLECELDEDGGDIEIDYAIEIDHAIAGRSVFQIKVKDAKGVSLKQ